MKLPSGPVAEKIGFVMSRVIVPLWVLTGALFKLSERTPKLLPKNIWTTAAEWGINLYYLLALLIALELLAVGVMFFVPRFARLMALFMLSCFCLILLGEMAAGNTKCGCLGAFSPPPWAMLLIDGAMLALVLVFRPRVDQESWITRRQALAAGAWILAGFLVSAAVVLPENARAGTVATQDGGDEAGEGSEGGDAAGTTSTGASGGSAGAGRAGDGRAARDLPPYFVLDADDWEGKRFLDTELAGFVDGWPDEVSVGPAYVIFYSRSCDHCQALLETHFQAPPVPTTLVAIPESKQGFNRSTWIDMQYCKACMTKELDLPTGVDWLITPPLVVALESGRVRCAKEADEAIEPECLSWH